MRSPCKSSATLRLYILCGALLISFSPALNAADVPKLINYQGKLTNAEGVSLGNGEYSVRFELFDAPSGGVLVWGETRTVTLMTGIFNVALGGAGAQPVPNTAVNDIGFAFGSSERFLQTTIVSGPGVSAEQTLAPRQQMTSVPFALESNRAKSVSDSSIARNSLHPLERIPAGAVQMFHSFGGSLPLPRGWMILNGDLVNQTNYDAIHGAGAYAEDGVANSALLSKRLPDMDGRYATGVDATSQNGTSAIAAVGNSGNIAPLASHTHNIPFSIGADTANGTGTIYFNGVATGPLPSPVVFVSRNISLQGNIGSYNGPNVAPTRATGGLDYTTTNFQSSANQNIRPDSIQFIFIIKVI